MELIFKYFTLDTDDHKINRVWFATEFDVSMFKELDIVFYLFIVYCVRLGIPASKKYFGVFLKSDLTLIIKKYKIMVYGVTDQFDMTTPTGLEEITRIVRDTLLSLYDTYDAIDDSTEFSVVVYNYLQKSAEKDSMNAMNAHAVKHLKDKDDIFEVSDSLIAALTKIKDTYSPEKVDRLKKYYPTDGMDNGTQSNKKFVTSTGIPALDEDYGIFTTDLVTWAGQPKSGKSRAAFRVAYRAAVKHGVDVRIDTLELTKSQVMNILVSMHVAALFKKKIPDQAVERNTVNEDNLKYFNAARQDLFNSGKYGKIFINYKDLTVETMYSDLKSFLEINTGVQLIVVDYLGRITSNRTVGKELDTAAIIDKSTKTLKDVASDCNICCIAMTQYNKEGINNALKGAPISVGDIQGGQAVQRDTDYHIDMTYTEEERTAGRRMISVSISRWSSGFSFVPLSVDLSISKFSQIAEI